jgi:hypothetical protein
MLGTSIWIFSDALDEDQMFYFIALLSPLFASLIIMAYDRRVLDNHSNTIPSLRRNTHLDQVLEFMVAETVTTRVNIRLIALLA